MYYKFTVSHKEDYKSFGIHDRKMNFEDAKAFMKLLSEKYPNEEGYAIKATHCQSIWDLDSPSRMEDITEQLLNK